MDIAIYLEQSIDLIKYIVQQVNWANFKPYYEYIYAGVGFLVLLILVTVILKRLRRKSTYLNNGVAIKFSFPPMANPYSGLQKILRALHELHVSHYGEKKHFTLEIVLLKGERSFVIYVSQEVYNAMPSKILEKAEIVTDYRRSFLTERNLSKGLYVDLELAKDFPYILGRVNDSKLKEEILNTSEQIFIQISMRPLKDNWKKRVDEFILQAKKGKDPSAASQGCVAGFIGITFPFFSFLGDVLTSLIHSSSSPESNHEKGAEKGYTSDKKIEMFNEKKTDIAFEFDLRALITTGSRNRSYELVNDFLDRYTVEQKDKNFFVVENANRKIKSSIRNDFYLGYLDPNEIDVLNINEIIDVVSRL